MERVRTRYETDSNYWVKREKSLWVAAKRQPKGFNIKGKVSFMFASGMV